MDARGPGEAWESGRATPGSCRLRNLHPAVLRASCTWTAAPGVILPPWFLLCSRAQACRSLPQPWQSPATWQGLPDPRGELHSRIHPWGLSSQARHPCLGWWLRADFPVILVWPSPSSVDAAPGMGPAPSTDGSSSLPRGPQERYLGWRSACLPLPCCRVL